MRLLEWVEPAAGSRVPPSISLDDLLAATGGRLLGPTAVTSVAGAAVDSRQVHPGSLFVALRGERVDGHRFVEEALRNGAVAALVERPVELAGQSGGGQGAAVIQVADSLVALQELAAWWRSRSIAWSVVRSAGSQA